MEEKDNSQEKIWVIQARAGDSDAFSSLVEMHWEPWVRFARSVIGAAEAEDCVQDALLIAWKKLGDLRSPEAFYSWMLRITAHLCFYRARFRFRFLSLDLFSRHVELPAPERIDTMDVERILHRLAPRQRAVMHLTFLEGMTDSEIGEVLQITADSVRSHRRRARESLDRILKTDHGQK